MPQEQDSHLSWTQNMYQDSLVPNVEDDDFNNFLDLDNEFNFGDVGQPQQTARSGLDTPMERLAFGHTPGEITNTGNADLNQQLMQDMEISMASIPGTQMIPLYSNTSQSGTQQYQAYQQYQQMQQSHHYQAPPTPVSGEMHGAKFGSAIDGHGQIIYDRQHTSFPSLVSPAQTPLDNAFNLPDYLIADDFFSPLTSPAIEAQHHFTSATTTASPVDLNIETQPNGTPVTAGKKRRKAPVSTSHAVRSVRQSPAMKPQSRRRPTSVNTSSLDKLEATLHEESSSVRIQPALVKNMPLVSSEDSVSPEPLLESLMRPPPLPSSRSPNSILKPHHTEKNAPATPSTLMKVLGGQIVDPGMNQQHSNPLAADVMEDIALPDAAAEMTTQILPEIDTCTIGEDDQSTPTISAKTPKLSADSTPRSTGPNPSNNSEESLKKSGRGGRLSKKRLSVPSAAISPALRPKISPSISPLVPASGTGVPILSAETSALYLASKSNYQNILDGTHLPGVSYPDTLAENLSSKRTSHKMAEQGRRNRINLALKEIESLLPASITSVSKKEKSNGKEESEENEKSASSMQGASKASTVEMAIIYIKSLQAELKVTQEKLEVAEKAIAEGNSSGSQASEQ